MTTDNNYDELVKDGVENGNMETGTTGSIVKSGGCSIRRSVMMIKSTK